MSNGNTAAIVGFTAVAAGALAGGGCVRIKAVNKELGYWRPLRVISPLELEDED